ncbi:hypothetical protein HYH03_003676 [Edaphochlamys debaryana]|uniref:Phosphoglycerate mutase n=1 Tax=Edaphochlamys debaryana TaxID=47281 RepID=A0A836C417_9CHLO|nr:hypothetical protein HYH03_003676 [Edaphochlamys debaryana]|eukprot:KAG2498418.1 hypothetical protein HYH03_003676 [Edaphochlamys debaryana]
MAGTLHNEYFLLRHGRSLANEAEIIVSSLENGADAKWTLAPAGEEQARRAGQVLAAALQEPQRAGKRVVALSSPFSRTLRTAELALEAAGLQGVRLEVAPELRERWFGDDLELQSYHRAYGTIWERDAESTSNRPGGNGESVEEVSGRMRALFKRLEASHQGCVVLLVSHGDSLSIMQSTMLGADTRHHRRFAFDTAELRPLAQVPPGAAVAEAGMAAGVPAGPVAVAEAVVARLE